MRAWIGVVLLCACRREVPLEARRDPAPPAPSVSTPAPPKPVHRVKGAIEGRFALASDDVVASEPIVAEFTLRPLESDLTMVVGGDMRNATNYPTRFAVRAVDEGGKVVCDLVEKPAFPSFGGPATERLLAKGETLTERFVVNPACPALAAPGVYKLTLHRRVTNMKMVVKKPTPTSCDVVPVHEDPLPATLDPACAALLGAAPSVTSDLTIRVRAFDQAAVRAAIADRLKEKDPILEHRVSAFVCRFVTCSCPPKPATADMIAAVGGAPQGAFPAACP